MTTTKIVQGPTKSSLFHHFQSTVDLVQVFYIGKPFVIPMHVTSIEREDGSGNNWIIKGWVANGGSGYVYSVYYNTQTQTGHMKTEDVERIKGFVFDQEKYDRHAQACYCDAWDTCDAH